MIQQSDQYGTVTFIGRRPEYYMLRDKFEIIQPGKSYDNVPLERVKQLLDTARFRADDRTVQLLRRFLPLTNEKNLKNLKANEPCFLIGSGSSLAGFDFSQLDDYFTIAINHSIEHYPKAHALLFGDGAFLQRTKFNLNEYEGMIFCSSNSGYFNRDQRNNVYRFKIQRTQVQGDFNSGLLFTMLSGTAAVNLAIIMGCSPIILLGFDLYVRDDGNNHFYEDIKGQRQPKGSYAGKVKYFEKFQPWADRIINCSMDSLITTFRKQHVEEVLAWLKSSPK